MLQYDEQGKRFQKRFSQNHSSVNAAFVVYHIEHSEVHVKKYTATFGLDTTHINTTQRRKLWRLHVLHTTKRSQTTEELDTCPRTCAIANNSCLSKHQEEMHLHRDQVH